MSKQQKTSIIIPAYNEASHIRQNIKYIDNAVSKIISDYEIIIVDDGSTDKTKLESSKIAEKNKRIKIIGYKNNMGKGKALIYGAKRARGDIIIFLDADLDIDPMQIKKPLNEMQKKDIDVVTFSKNHPNSITNFPLYRRILSKGYYFLIRFFFNIPLTDTQVGLKIFRRKALAPAIPFIRTKKFAFDLELLLYINSFGFKIAEYPIVINFKRKTVRINTKNIIQMIIDTTNIFFNFRITRKRFKNSVIRNESLSCS